MVRDANITQLLQSARTDRAASDQLYTLVYAELRKVAHNQLRSERAGHTLQTTALANEVYLKLIGHDRVDWENRAQFFAIAARAMRRLLVDYARARNREKRGGGAEHLPLEFADRAAGPEPTTDLVALNEALTRFQEEDPVKCQVVEMRYFAGLTTEEIASVLGISSRTVERHWRYARAWLYRALTDGTAGEGE
jgi:RNA polymerase sigma factor (TIGR02999 family)